MENSIRHLLHAAVKAVNVLLLGGFCAAGGSILAGEAPAANPLRVGVAPIFPPMIFKEAGKIAGVEADLARALAGDLGRPLQFVELPWEDLLDALDEGKVDIVMSSMSITEARRFRAAFCDPYLRVGQMALVRGGDKLLFGVEGFSLRDREVGVIPATTADYLVRQEFSKAKRRTFKSGQEAAAALVKGKIDLYISDSPMVWYLAGMYEAKGLAVVPRLLTNEALAWAVRRSDSPLRESANIFLKKIQESGQFNKTMLTWIPTFQ